MNNKTVQENEKAKRAFFSFMRGPEGYAEDSIIAFERAILFWQDFTKDENFSKFSKKRAIDFNNWLKNKKKADSTDKISLGYCYHNLRRLRKFFEWLAKQPKYKSKISIIDVGFLKLSRKESRIATEPKAKEIPSYEEIMKVIDSIKIESEVDSRDRALICFVLLTVARVSALISLPIESFDKNKQTIYQSPKLGVKTKYSKRIVTTFFPLPDSRIADFFLEWIDYLVNKRNFKKSDPIFPSTLLGKDLESVNFCNTGKVKPVFWKDSCAVREIFKKRFQEAGVKYYHPHTIRHLIPRIFAKARLTEEEKKAVSQNLGHEDVGTTFGSYGYHKIEEDRQIDVVRNINLNQAGGETQYVLNEKQLEELAKKLR